MTPEILSLHFSHKRRGILARVGFRKRDRDPSLSHGSQELDAALLMTAVPLQLVACHIAVLPGCDMDKPRSLARASQWSNAC